jgi:RimJ/RimL family protein N-acetyltransferase
MKKPILLDFPDQFETERLLIRAPRAGDGPAVAAAIGESYAELAPWMPWATPDPDVDETEANLREALARWIKREDLRLNLYRKADGAFVGGSGLHRIQWQVPRVEIGYWCRTRFTGQGYITEAVHAITAFACDALGARRVEIRCDALNLRSRRVAERAGFTLEATLRQDDRALSGELRDTLVFVKLR